MEDWFLIPTMAAVFAFGYFVVRRLDAYILENQQRITEGVHQNRRCIRIAAETSCLLDDISEALEDCSGAIPYMEFFLSSGSRSRLLGRLSDGTLDIALLRETDPRELPPECRFARIPHRSARSVSSFGLSLKEEDQGSCTLLVWNREIPSRDRDRVIYMIENEHPATAVSR